MTLPSSRASLTVWCSRLASHLMVVHRLRVSLWIWMEGGGIRSSQQPCPVADTVDSDELADDPLAHGSCDSTDTVQTFIATMIHRIPHRL